MFAPSAPSAPSRLEIASAHVRRKPISVIARSIKSSFNYVMLFLEISTVSTSDINQYGRCVPRRRVQRDQSAH